MKLAAIQFRPPKADPDLARQGLQDLIEQAGAEGANLIVCPEMAITGYIWDSPAEISPYVEPARGPTFAMLSAQARQHRAWIVCGFAERAGGALFNSALVVDPWGDLARCYRKILLYPADTTWARPGTERMTCEADFGRLAPAICMDLNDDGLIRFLHRAGVDVLAFCTNWIQEGAEVHPYWQWRLMGWDGWMVAANSWGEDRGTTFSGGSAILAPGGRVVAHAPAAGDAVLVVDTDEIPAPSVVPDPDDLW